jgi:pimeloyl-ACP methyl ester carboxylesterase
MFSETRYAMNGDLRVAYRASREGTRDIVLVPSWLNCCEVLPEMPSAQGWYEAMTSLGRLIFFDHPGSGLSDPVTPGAMPTLEQWADSITAVLDDLGSREAVVLCLAFSAFAPGALFAATHPSRTTALIALEGYADTTTVERARESVAEMATLWGTGELEHFLNPDMPWNEEIRASWAGFERFSGSPVKMMLPLLTDLDVRAVLPTIRVPTLVMQHTDHMLHATWGHTRKYIADVLPGFPERRSAIVVAVVLRRDGDAVQRLGVSVGERQRRDKDQRGGDNGLLHMCPHIRTIKNIRQNSRNTPKQAGRSYPRSGQYRRTATRLEMERVARRGL